MNRKCSKCGCKLRFATGELRNGERWVCDNCFNYITIFAIDNADDELDPNFHGIDLNKEE